jgi:tRNA nucleotidyltransferase (CCA-adding enzyme)
MSQDVTELLLRHLSPAMQAHLHQIRLLANELDTAVYFIGGLVRDLLLGQNSHDLDVVLESNALEFAQAIHHQHGGQLTLHPRFGTATWWPQDSPAIIDFITARAESYPHPGALPVIQHATLTADLARRDYTLNALAIRLDDPHFGTLLDLHGGLADLQAGLLRVLHPHSFQDDATRIWRGVRYEQRLGFNFAPETATYLQRDLDYLRTISGDRIRHELA